MLITFLWSHIFSKPLAERSSCSQCLNLPEFFLPLSHVCAISLFLAPSYRSIYCIYSHFSQMIQLRQHVPFSQFFLFLVDVMSTFLQIHLGKAWYSFCFTTHIYEIIINVTILPTCFFSRLVTFVWPFDYFKLIEICWSWYYWKHILLDTYSCNFV